MRQLELEYYVLNYKMTSEQLDDAPSSKVIISEEDLFELIKQNYIQVDYSQGEYIDEHNFYFELK